MVSDSPVLCAQIGPVRGLPPVQPAIVPSHRAPARSYPAEHVWLLGLVVIGRQITLSYADVTGLAEPIAHAQ